jgi:environmental stress-induced protein Ves
MPQIDLLRAEDYRRIPWKNGRGELVVITRAGGDSWEGTDIDNRVAWHFGRTAIVEEGPFSDYSGYERLQVVIDGAGLVLVAPDHEIDLRIPMRPQRYDGGTPIRTRLEQGPVEVVNLIADRTRFAIDLRVVSAGAALVCEAGCHIVYPPAGAVNVRIGDREIVLEKDQALRIETGSPVEFSVVTGVTLIGSIRAKD